MSKKANFKLEELRVESFLTQLEDDKKEKVKGGCYYTYYKSGCPVTRFCTESIVPPICCAELEEQQHPDIKSKPFYWIEKIS